MLETMGSWLITGGSGYIGSHVASLLWEQGFEVRIYDKKEVRADQVKSERFQFFSGDLENQDTLYRALEGVDGVIHLAGIKFPGLSVEDPIWTYRNNVSGTLNLLSAMKALSIDKIIFSSSCSVYGFPKNCPVHEETELLPESPYAKSKIMSEQMIIDFARSTNPFPLSFCILRYFNVIGVAENGVEDNSNQNLVPNLVNAIRRNQPVRIFGNEFSTKDGTCERDYIDVEEIAFAHLLVIRRMMTKMMHEIFNLSTGIPTSNLEIVKVMQKYVELPISILFEKARVGDPASIYGNSDKFETEFGWKPTKIVPDILQSVVKRTLGDCK
jgi:UDP-glucose 4-epimerase